MPCTSAIKLITIGAVDFSRQSADARIVTEGRMSDPGRGDAADRRGRFHC